MQLDSRVVTSDEMKLYVCNGDNAARSGKMFMQLSSCQSRRKFPLQKKHTSLAPQQQM